MAWDRALSEGFGYFSAGMDATGRFTEVVKGIDIRCAVSYHQRRRQGGLGIASSKFDMGNPGL